MCLQRVTPWNVVKLREAIINGSEIHPGATHYVDKLSTQRLPPNRKARISISRKLPSSRGAITQPGKNFDYEFEGKIVLRHLQDGDVVLVNRQVLGPYQLLAVLIHTSSLFIFIQVVCCLKNRNFAW